ncbi:MAG: YtxH domain-containing protein, partial [Bacteroidota bacterium]|nr:YtxH domain-containing protein [Bacteroidota bacterium]
MSTGKVLLGLLAGVATGALLGVLFAPDKGVNTRRKISCKGKELKDDLTEKFDEVIDDISEKFEQMKKDVKGYAEKT